jgi:hypothetical protein
MVMHDTLEANKTQTTGITNRSVFRQRQQPAYQAACDINDFLHMQVLQAPMLLKRPLHLHSLFLNTSANPSTTR